MLGRRTAFTLNFPCNKNVDHVRALFMVIGCWSWNPRYSLLYQNLQHVLHFTPDEKQDDALFFRGVRRQFPTFHAQDKKASCVDDARKTRFRRLMNPDMLLVQNAMTQKHFRSLALTPNISGSLELKRVCVRACAATVQKQFVTSFFPGYTCYMPLSSSLSLAISSFAASWQLGHPRSYFLH